MSIQLPPHASANSYATLAEAAALLAGKADWLNYSAERREAALMAATTILDRKPWKGEAAYTIAQNPLRWPRWGARNDDGQTYDSTTLPAALKQATAELAYLLVTGAVTDAGSSGSATSAAVSGVKVGDIELRYDTAVTVASGGFQSGYGSVVDMLIAPLVRGNGATASLYR
jgi:hypothetical protein